MTSKHFFTALETKINATLAGVKRRAKRGPRKEGPRLPRKKPTRRGTKHSRAAEEQPGDAFLSRAASGVTIRYAPLGGDTIGNFVAPNVVTLDTDQPAVDAALKSGNGLAGAVLIASLLSSVEPNGPQQMMLFSVPALAEVEPAKRFGFLMATLLRDDLGLDGSQVVPSAVPQAAE